LQQQQKFIALAMATQREILDACMNDEPRQKQNEKKKNTSSTPKYDQETAKKQDFKTGNQTVRRSILNRKKKKKKKKRKTKQNKNRPSAATHLPTYLQEKQEQRRRRL
jgi:hypothetical protein